MPKLSLSVPLLITGVVLNARMAMASGCSMRLQPKLFSLAGTHPLSNLPNCRKFDLTDRHEGDHHERNHGHHRFGNDRS